MKQVILANSDYMRLTTDELFPVVEHYGEYLRWFYPEKQYEHENLWYPEDFWTELHNILDCDEKHLIISGYRNLLTGLRLLHQRGEIELKGLYFPKDLSPRWIFFDHKANFQDTNDWIEDYFNGYFEVNLTGEFLRGMC